MLARSLVRGHFVSHAVSHARRNDEALSISDTVVQNSTGTLFVWRQYVTLTQYVPARWPESAGERGDYA
ncbi:MAG: hypothetical protein OJF49_002347 [Ktedonobacterales bacterium]|nr:MAG: hypothetical protein OJF49_002347 [Ktedonobacterales bacterium]